MEQLSGRRILLRWAFLGIGYLLLFGHRVVVPYILMANTWGQLLFGFGSAMYAFLMAAAHFYILAAWALCMLTSWALRRNKPWGADVGIAACVISVPWFPIMTVLGGLGIYLLLPLRGARVVEADSRDGLLRDAARRSSDFWIRKRQSRLQPAIITVFGIVTLFTLGFASRWAAHRGMPAGRWGLLFWAWFFAFGTFQIAIHEFGHAIVAWALYYRVRVVSIGPFTLTNGANGFRFRFDWRRLFEDSGYTGSVATRVEHARRNHIAVVAAGPAASALAGLVFTVAMFAAPGSSWQSFWWVAAINAVLGIGGAIMNLIPVGYSDGTMLLHLILNTPAGRILLAADAIAAAEEAARADHERADFQKEVETKRRMLERALEGGALHSMAIALSYQTLGGALLATRDWPGAEAAFRRSLEFEAEIEANPALRANVWSGLTQVRARRNQVVEAGQAYATAVGMIRDRKAGAQGLVRGVSCAMLAQAHARTLNWEEALREANEGLSNVLLTPSNLILYASLLAVRAEAHFNLGHHDQGLSGASDAGAALRSIAMPASRQNLAADDLGDLGEELWRAGEFELGIELVRDSIGRLDTGGAAMAAMARRIQLVGLLRRCGRFAEAGRLLPPDAALPPNLRRELLAETAELAMVAEELPIAVENARTAAALWEAEGPDCALELAAAKSLLARALRGAGSLPEAEAQAAGALEALKLSRHPEAALCLVTLNAVRHTAVDGSEAKGLLEAAILLTGPERLLWTDVVDRADRAAKRASSAAAAV